MAEAMRNDFPEIESIARISPWFFNRLVEVDDRKFMEKWVLRADSSFFNVSATHLLF